MGRKFLKIISTILTAVLAFGIVGCGVDDNVKAETVVIYKATGSLEGTEDDLVKEAIEEKYYQDTGRKIDLQIHVMSQEGFYGKIDRGLIAGEQIDGLVSHLGTGGGTVEDWVFSTANRYLDISDLLEEYGQNIIKTVGKAGLFRMSTLEGEIFGIPDYINPNKYGILVRKDWMSEAGYTDNPAEVSEDKKLLVTLDDFLDMLRAMRRNKTFEEAPYILAGQPWDVARVITSGAFGPLVASEYSVEYEEDGVTVKSLKPSYTDERYKEIIQFYINLIEGDVPKNGSQKSTLWIKNSSAISAEAKIQQDFISGKAGVYIGYPTITKLITTKRLTMAQNPGLEEDAFTVIGSLKGANGEDYGFKQDDIAFTGLVFMANTKQAETTIQYLDWMYSDVENYELCNLGIKGRHWIESGENGYRYPEGKEATYLMSPPYSGCFTIIPNEKMSNRMYDNYTELEKKWIEISRNNKMVASPFYGMRLPSPTGDVAFEIDDVSSMASSILSAIYTGETKCIPWGKDALGSYIYKGLNDKVNYRGQEMNAVDAFIAKANADIPNYIDWLNNQYKVMSQLRDLYING